MSDIIRCNNCGTTWTEAALDPVHDDWGRVEPGGVVPLGQCPNGDCRALCYPPYGYVYDVEHRVTALRHVITQLLEWESAMGGWEAPVWEQARRVLAWSRGDNPVGEET